MKMWVKLETRRQTEEGEGEDSVKSRAASRPPEHSANSSHLCPRERAACPPAPWRALVPVLLGRCPVGYLVPPEMVRSGVHALLPAKPQEAALPARK